MSGRDDRDVVSSARAERSAPSAPAAAPGAHRRPGRLGAWVLTAAYATIVSFGAVHHEPWRDEVVPLSIARHAHSLVELTRPLKFEGHPILWYLVLWIGNGLVGRAWILKVASAASAIGAVFLLARSPLAWWLKTLVAFSFFPLYQYAVVSRGYSLEMLVLCAFCALYPRRGEHPVALAFVLAALANTEAYGLVMALAAAAMLLVEAGMRGGLRAVRVDRGVVAGAVVFVLGLALAVAVAFPDPAHPLTGFEHLAPSSLAAGLGRAVLAPVGHAGTFGIVPVPSAFAWAYFIYLVPRPSVLCFAAVALVGIETLSNVVYGPGAPWHVGNLVLVLVAAMWLDASGSAPALALSPVLVGARRWLGRALALAVAVVFAGQVALGVAHLRADLRYDYSANRRLAELLRSDPALANAVVMGEPDTPLWSVPYYADNRIYLAREDTFRAWGMYGPQRATTYDLAALLSAARRIRSECGCAVVVTLGWPLAEPGTYANFTGTRFEEHFVATADAREAFFAATRLLARLGPTITDENYDVYVLR